MSEEIISLWIAFVLAVGLSGALIIFSLTYDKCFKAERTVRRRKSVDKIKKERGRLWAKIQQIRADIQTLQDTTKRMSAMLVFYKAKESTITARLKQIDSQIIDYEQRNKFKKDIKEKSENKILK
ncbi:MAG: hypothetical protein ACLSUU_02830 [Christensenellales bacterium]|jgi:hypothetical protein